MSVEFAAKSFFPICPEIKKKMDSRRLMYFGDPVEAFFQPYVLMAPPSKVLQWNKQKQNGSIPDHNIQKDVKKNTTRACLDFLLHQI